MGLPKPPQHMINLIVLPDLVDEVGGGGGVDDPRMIDIVNLVLVDLVNLVPRRPSHDR